MCLFSMTVQGLVVNHENSGRHAIIYSGPSIRLSKSPLHRVFDPEVVIIAFECALQVLILR